LIFNIPLYIVHRIITYKYYTVFPVIGKEFYLTFLFLETVKIRDNSFQKEYDTKKAVRWEGVYWYGI